MAASNLGVLTFEIEGGDSLSRRIPDCDHVRWVIVRTDLKDRLCAAHPDEHANAVRRRDCGKRWPISSLHVQLIESRIKFGNGIDVMNDHSISDGPVASRLTHTVSTSNWFVVSASPMSAAALLAGSTRQQSGTTQFLDEHVFHWSDRRSSESVATRVATRLLHRRKPIVDSTRGLGFEIGSGTGTRTPNLAVNRSPQPVQKSRAEFADCR